MPKKFRRNQPGVAHKKEITPIAASNVAVTPASVSKAALSPRASAANAAVIAATQSSQIIREFKNIGIVTGILIVLLIVCYILFR